MLSHASCVGTVSRAEQDVKPLYVRSASHKSTVEITSIFMISQAGCGHVDRSAVAS